MIELKNDMTTKHFRYCVLKYIPCFDDDDFFLQTIGSSVALYQISPNLSAIMFVIVPSVILVGTTIGGILRKLSKMAQAQTAKAIEVGEEAISNVRTVRAFAMEEFEIDRYGEEVEKSRQMNEWLGMGVYICKGRVNLLHCS